MRNTALTDITGKQCTSFTGDKSENEEHVHCTLECGVEQEVIIGHPSISIPPEVP